MITKTNKNQERQRRHNRVRAKVSGTPKCPRLCVYRSLSEIYAQIIDDENSKTLISCSSKSKDLANDIKGKNKTEIASIVGEKVGELAKSKKIKKVVFDRGGYLYTGRVQALADGARKAGLDF